MEYQSGSPVPGPAQHRLVAPAPSEFPDVRLQYLADDNLTIWVNVASVGTSVSGNADGGVVSLMLDGSTISMHDFGNVAQDAIERVTLSLTLAVSAGSHEIRVQMVREFPTNDGTPRLYLDNIRALTDAQLLTGPEPLPLLAVLALGLWGAQRRLR